MLDSSTVTTVGIVLVTIAFIAYGGAFLMRVLGGKAPANDLQKTFYRAGHAHAGVLVTLGMLIAIFVDLADIGGVAGALSKGVLFGAILMPAGFFLSVAGTNPSKPNGLIALVWVGAASVVVGVLGAGLGALVA